MHCLCFSIIVTRSAYAHDIAQHNHETTVRMTHEHNASIYKEHKEKIWRTEYEHKWQTTVHSISQK